MQVLVLASGSRYRAELLTRLRLPFCQFSPDIDESPHSNEAATALARRLARGKALSTSESRLEDLFPAANKPFAAIVIASDQVAAIGEQKLGKPGTEEKAIEQLTAMQGQTVEFHTALHLLNLENGEQFSALDTTRATLRSLNRNEIERYIATDQPLDCAGSFKVESLGISLFTAVETKDPTALIGLPMIALCEGLRSFGLSLP